LVIFEATPKDFLMTRPTDIGAFVGLIKERMRMFPEHAETYQKMLGIIRASGGEYMETFFWLYYSTQPINTAAHQYSKDCPS
jgi:hypothetical protein